MLEVGARLPEAKVWLAPRHDLALRELVEDGPVLLFFYLFDFSAT